MRSWVRADDQRRGVTAGAVASAATPQVAGTVEEENVELRRRIRESEEDPA